MAEDYRHLFQAAEPNPSFLLEEEDGGGVGSLLAALSQVRSTLDRERAEAPALAAELLALAPEAREERLRREPRFHNWGVCELLIRRSLEEEADPAGAGHLAALALVGADLLDPARHAPPVVSDLKARAWAAAGEARLRQGDLPGVEDVLRSAASCLAQGTGDLLVEGRLLEFEARVRRHQGRSGEAAALLKMAAARYREIGDGELLARVLAEREAILRQNPARPSS